MFERVTQYPKNRKIGKLAPVVLRAGFAQAVNNEQGVFWLPELARGKGKLTSGSTQPWALLGAAGLLEEKNHIQKVEIPEPDGIWETLPAYRVTQLGEIICARSFTDEEFSQQTEAVQARIDAVNDALSQATSTALAGLVTNPN